jgi:hypothetical protein
MEPVVSLLDQTVATLNRQLELLGIDGDIEDAPAIHALRTRLTAFDNTEIIDDFFQQVLGPLLKRLYPTNLYPDGIPATDQEKFNNLHVAARCHAQLMMNSAAESLRDDLVTQGRIADNKRSLPLAACEAVLKAGVDHVLVGMRRKEYVDTLSSLFGSPQNGSSVCH